MPANFHPNPTLYARLSQPRSEAEARAALAAFDADVTAARERHGIANVVIAVSCFVAPTEEGGEPKQLQSIASYGSLATAVGLGVAVFKWARACHVEMLNRAAGLGSEEGEEAP